MIIPEVSTKERALLLQSPQIGLSAEQIIEGRIVAAEILRSMPGLAQALHNASVSLPSVP
jgi:hypothetical protein